MQPLVPCALLPIQAQLLMCLPLTRLPACQYHPDFYYTVSSPTTALANYPAGAGGTSDGRPSTLCSTDPVDAAIGCPFLRPSPPPSPTAPPPLPPSPAPAPPPSPHSPPSPWMPPPPPSLPPTPPIHPPSSPFPLPPPCPPPPSPTAPPSTPPQLDIYLDDVDHLLIRAAEEIAWAGQLAVHALLTLYARDPFTAGALLLLLLVLLYRIVYPSQKTVTPAPRTHQTYPYRWHGEPKDGKDGLDATRPCCGYTARPRPRSASQHSAAGDAAAAGSASIGAVANRAEHAWLCECQCADARGCGTSRPGSPSYL